MESSRRDMVLSRLTGKLRDYELDRAALQKQVGELQARLQAAEIHNSCQEDVKQLTTKLEEKQEEKQEEKLGKQEQEDGCSLQEEVKRLRALLAKERGASFQERHIREQLATELQATKEQVVRHKRHKEDVINREKETRRELERLERLSDPATLHAFRIANDAHQDMKRRKRKLLLRDYEELMAAHRINQEKFTAELQAEREKTDRLGKKLQQQEADMQEVRQELEAELKAEREKSDRLQNQLQEETRAREWRESEYLH